MSRAPRKNSSDLVDTHDFVAAVVEDPHRDLAVARTWSRRDRPAAPSDRVGKRGSGFGLLNDVAHGTEPLDGDLRVAPDRSPQLVVEVLLP